MVDPLAEAKPLTGLGPSHGQRRYDPDKRAYDLLKELRNWSACVGPWVARQPTGSGARTGGAWLG